MPNQWGTYWQNANGKRKRSQLGTQVEHHQHRVKAGWDSVRIFVLMEEMEGIFFFFSGWGESKGRDPIVSLCSLASYLDGRSHLKVIYMFSILILFSGF